MLQVHCSAWHCNMGISCRYVDVDVVLLLKMVKCNGFFMILHLSAWIITIAQQKQQIMLGSWTQRACRGWNFKRWLHVATSCVGFHLIVAPWQNKNQPTTMKKTIQTNNNVIMFHQTPLAAYGSLQFAVFALLVWPQSISIMRGQADKPLPKRPANQPAAQLTIEPAKAAVSMQHRHSKISLIKAIKRIVSILQCLLHCNVHCTLHRLHLPPLAGTAAWPAHCKLLLAARLLLKSFVAPPLQRRRRRRLLRQCRA